MKIVRNTPDQLILRSVPWVIGIVLSGAILGLSAASLTGFLQTEYLFGTVMLLSALFVGVFFALFVRRDDLILDRSRNQIELRHATVFGRHKVRHDLTHLRNAIVQQQSAAGSGSKNDTALTFRVALVLEGGMDAGTHPVTEVFSDGNSALKAADAINNWLKQ